MSTHVSQYWRGVTQRLQAEVEQMNQLITHQGVKGTENELSLARLVQNLVPRRFGVGSGILVDSKGGTSKQMDIVIYEQGNEPALFAQTNQVLFPVENVRLCLEVKTSIGSTEIQDAREKKKSITDLYSSTEIHPLFALFGYRGSSYAHTIASSLEPEATDRGPRPDAAVVVSLALFLRGVTTGCGWDGGIAALHESSDGIPLPRKFQTPGTNDGSMVVRDGITYPVVQRHKDSDVIADPSRALLLFSAWVSEVLRAEHSVSVINAYIDSTTKELLAP